MNGILKMTRRDLLKSGVLIGSGLVLGIRLHEKPAGAERAPEYFVPNAFLHISEDDRITIFINKSSHGRFDF